MRIGYARVSTAGQELRRQLDELEAGGCERVHSEVAGGGRGVVRPEWEACRRSLRAGDELVVTELSRLGRNAGEVCRLADELADGGIGLVILGLGLDSRTPTGKLVVTVLAAVAEMERDLLRERTRSGLAAARARGRHPGRPRAAKPRDIKRAAELLRGAPQPQRRPGPSASADPPFTGTWQTWTAAERERGHRAATRGPRQAPPGAGGAQSLSRYSPNRPARQRSP